MLGSILSTVEGLEYGFPVLWRDAYAVIDDRHDQSVFPDIDFQGNRAPLLGVVNCVKGFLKALPAALVSTETSILSCRGGLKANWRSSIAASSANSAAKVLKSTNVLAAAPLGTGPPPCVRS